MVLLNICKSVLVSSSKVMHLLIRPSAQHLQNFRKHL